jgi:hypothetical protein
MAFTVTVTERPKDEAAPGKSCDNCILLTCDAGAPEHSTADVEDWAAVGLSPMED